ncbi:MAG: hypothetical protein FWD23_05740 [Oscillospiraceae bacterium]|nr:hypothetical protein [Oscillospiraceae bacterium]
MKHKIILFFIILILIFINLFSCNADTTDKNQKNDADNNENAGSADQTQSDEPEDMFATIGDGDFAGYEFTFLTLEAGINDTNRFVQEIMVEEETGDTIDDAIFRRNSMLFDRYNVKIKTVPSMNPDGDARKTIKAGDDIYDMVNLYKGSAMALASEGLFKNFHDLQNVDFSAPWWSARCAAGLAVQGRLYNMSGSILISEIDDTLAMIFNKKLAENYEVENLYSLVKQGEWTLDKMSKIVKNISSDLNGDGAYKPKDDLFGYIQDPASMTFNWVFSSDLLRGYIDGDGKYEPNADIARCQSLVDMLYDLFVDKQSAYTGLDLYEGLKYFEDNRIFLYAIILRNIELLRGMDVDFGVLPYPKLDENQKSYLTHVGGASPIMCIPITNGENNRTGYVLEAMSIASYNIAVPAYYDIALKTKYSRDDDSSEMLDIILESRMYDISYYAGNSLISMIAPMITKVEHNFASVYEKQSANIFKNLQKIIDKLINID